MGLGKQITVLVVLLGVSTVVGAVLLSFGLQLYFFGLAPGARIALIYTVRFSAYVSLYALPVAAGFGVPAFFILRRLGVLRWWSVGALGALLGAAGGATSVMADVPWPASVALGLASALIAWRLIVHSDLPLRPDAPKSQL